MHARLIHSHKLTVATSRLTVTAKKFSINFNTEQQQAPKPTAVFLFYNLSAVAFIHKVTTSILTF